MLLSTLGVKSLGNKASLLTLVFKDVCGCLHAGEEPGNKAPSLSHKNVMDLKVSIGQHHLSHLSTLERGVFPSDPPIA